MPDLRDQLAAFQQFAVQQVDGGEAESLEKLFNPGVYLKSRPTSTQPFAKASMTSKPVGIGPPTR